MWTILLHFTLLTGILPMREENAENAVSQSLRGEVIFASQTLLVARVSQPSHCGYRAKLYRQNK